MDDIKSYIIARIYIFASSWQVALAIFIIGLGILPFGYLAVHFLPESYPQYGLTWVVSILFALFIHLLSAKSFYRAAARKLRKRLETKRAFKIAQKSELERLISAYVPTAVENHRKQLDEWIECFESLIEYFKLETDKLEKKTMSARIESLEELIDEALNDKNNLDPVFDRINEQKDKILSWIDADIEDIDAKILCIDEILQKELRKRKKK